MSNTPLFKSCIVKRPSKKESDTEPVSLRDSESLHSNLAVLLPSDLVPQPQPQPQPLDLVPQPLDLIPQPQPQPLDLIPQTSDSVHSDLVEEDHSIHQIQKCK